MNKILAAVAMIAALMAPAWAQAAPALIITTCNLATSSGDQVSYVFEGDGTPDQLTEIGYSKNGWTAPNHRPTWRIDEATWSLIPNETPDYALRLATTNDPELLSAGLFHNGNYMAGGSCSRRAAPGAPPLTRVARPVAPVAPAPVIPPPPAPVAPVQSVNTVPLMSALGENWVKVIIGGRAVTGILDTGATVLSIPEDVTVEMVAAGEAYWAGRSESVMDANGKSSLSYVFIVRQLTLGSQTLTNVEASTSPKGAPALIGMSVLGRLGPMKLDATRGVVTFG
jgi:hypothetical protein